MRIGLALLISALVSFAGCGSRTENTANGPVQNAAEKSGRPQDAATPKEDQGISATAACYAVDARPKAVLRSQTFAIDFEPFRNSCFVTAHDRQFKDPPLDSEFAIYRDGRRVFDFPEQFNGVEAGCWVEAVAFHDVNSDSRTDVIVIGKCSAKTEPYHENMVYLNTGRALITDTKANYSLAELTTVKDVSAYVKSNPTLFSADTNASSDNR